MFSTFFDDVFTTFDSLVNDNRLSFREAFPPYNIYTTEDKSCVIELALAGYNKDDLKVSVDNNIVTIETVMEDDGTEDNNHYISHRVKTLPFIRKYSVPTLDFDLNNLEVKFLNGLLTVKIPHKQEKVVTSKTIEIK